MAMTIADLKSKLSGIQGGVFTLADDALGIDGVKQLFDKYLPDNTLTVKSAVADVNALTVAGTISITGVGDSLNAAVSFSADDTNTNVTGILISAQINGWEISTSYLKFSGAFLQGFGFKTLYLVFAAQPDDLGNVAPQVGIGADFIFNTPDGPKTLKLIALLPLDSSADYALTAAFDDVSVSDLSALAQFAANCNFNIIPSQVPLAKSMQLVALRVVVDPTSSTIALVSVDVKVADSWPVIPGKFEFEAVYASFTITYPTVSPGVTASLYTTFNIDNVIEMTAGIIIPDLDMEAVLDRPAQLAPLINQYLPGVQINNFNLGDMGLYLNAKTLDYKALISISDDWPLIDNYSITNLYMMITGEGASVPGGAISATFDIAGTSMSVGAAYTSEIGWLFQGGLVEGQTVDMGALVQDLENKFSITLPDALVSFTLTEFDVSVNSYNDNFSLTCTCGVNFQVTEQPFVASVTINVSKSAASAVEWSATGQLTIGGTVFIITFDDTSGAKRFTASMGETDKPLSFSDIADEFNIDLSGVPAELIPALTGVSFTYDFTSSTAVLTASTVHTQTVLLTLPGQNSGPRVYAALLGVNVSVSLSALPLIGQKLAAIENMGVEGMQLLVTSGALTQQEVADLNKLIPADPPGLPTLPPQALDKGVMLAIPLMLGNNRATPLAIQFGGSQGQQQTLMKGLAASTDSSSVPKAAWLNVEKSFGPVNIKRVGLTYQEQKVWLLLDASFLISALSIGLDGLSLGFTLAMPPAISPALHGLSISYQGGPVQISGGFLEITNSDGSIEYDGEALISAEAFMLAAIGSYSTINNEPSLFIFAMLDAPLGGPSFFFVTGLAAGFGFNRDLLIPTLDKLPGFPLVAAAMAGQTGQNPFSGSEDNPAAALEVMHEYIPRAYGEDWLAVGVRFTSFEIIQSFALLTAAFGTRFEVALLGLSAVTVPPLAPDPIGFAELALEVSFSPDDGLLAVSAGLTPESYILSKSCHLTGGFAFYIWFKDNADGASAGEFVVTLGGYHPDFSKPSYYPAEPRLGVNWQVSSNLIVKGGFYFALTPSAVMAGGFLEATWHSGDLKAWFNADANFLLSWKPFHYEADMNLSLGASYKVNLLFTSFTVTVHVGVGLRLWGPSFAGKARVDLDVVSFTISFGDSDPSIAPISWTEFKASFLPGSNSNQTSSQANNISRSNLEADPPPNQTDTYCYVSVSGGLVKDLSRDKKSQDDPDWVIDPERFALVTHSVIPCNQASLVTGSGGDQNSGNKTVELTGTWSTDGFGVGPVGVANSDFVSSHIITFNMIDGGVPVYSFDFSVYCVPVPVLSNVPRAPWSKDAALNPNISSLNSKPSNISNTLAGFTLSPTVPPPDHTPLPIEVSVLQETLDPKEVDFKWAAPDIPAGDSFDQTGAMAELQSTVSGNPTINAARISILSALVAQGVEINTNVDMSRTAASASDVLLSAPVLSYLGEEPVDSQTR